MLCKLKWIIKQARDWLELDTHVAAVTRSHFRSDQTTTTRMTEKQVLVMNLDQRLDCQAAVILSVGKARVRYWILPQARVITALMG